MESIQIKTRLKCIVWIWFDSIHSPCSHCIRQDILISSCFCFLWLPLSSSFDRYNIIITSSEYSRNKMLTDLFDRDTFENIRKDLQMWNAKRRRRRRRRKKLWKIRIRTTRRMNNWLMCQRHFNGCNKSTARHLIIFLPSFKRHTIYIRSVFDFNIWKIEDKLIAQAKKIQF